MTSIRIHSHTFTLSDPYSSRVKPVRAPELAALDRLRAENIRNNLAKQMDKIDWPLKGKDLEAFEFKVAQADASYEFQVVEAQSRRSPFDRELEAVAEEMAEQMLRAEGTFNTTREQIQALAGELKEEKEAQMEARRRLEAKKAAALEGLEEIL